MIRGPSRPSFLAWSSLLFAAGSCAQEPGGEGASTTSSRAQSSVPSSDETKGPVWWPVHVHVALDQGAAANTVLKQGGVERTVVTDEQGNARVLVDLALQGEIVLHASHPDARIGYAHIDPVQPPKQLRMQLHRFDRSDNPNYEFWAPGTPDNLLNCAHCHHKMNATWWGSPHRHAASNPTVQDLYSGVVSALDSQASCEQAGGRWREGRIPGSSDKGMRCYLGTGALPALNDQCGDDRVCDDLATDFGGCADCHAPGINGKIGGRNLLDATGAAYDSGVHCDVCHKVESIHPGKAPGVAGYLQILRPTEPPSIPGETFEPLLFGPFHDVSQIQMGAVYRDHFRKAEFCAGCHDYGVKVRPRWGVLDSAKWPSNRLPIQTTYNEWKQGPFAPRNICASCHMPVDTTADNAAGLEDSIASGPSQIAGWIRPLGEIRKHSWIGPRTPSSGLLQRSASLSIAATPRGDALDVGVTVLNRGAGHAIPTGLPSRSMILVVQAFCGEESLAALGGDIVPDFSGYYSKRDRGESWDRWPGAKVGDVVRVARRTGEVLRGDALAHFGEALGPQKPLAGFERLSWVGQSTIIKVDSKGNSTFDSPLQAGDVAFLGDAFDPQAPMPQRLAGLPGFAFARVLVDQKGALNVPSFQAVDVRNDNRILPQQKWRSNHQFELRCVNPEVRATLLYRSFPPSWVQERRWDRPDLIVSSARLQLPGQVSVPTHSLNR